MLIKDKDVEVLIFTMESILKALKTLDHPQKSITTRKYREAVMVLGNAFTAIDQLLNRGLSKQRMKRLLDKFHKIYNL